MSVARVLATATPLPKGEVLGAGGGPNVSSNCLATAELFNPATGQWTTTGRMTTPHCNHSATLRANGQVLVAGGGNSTGFNSLNIAELFNPATGTWQATARLSGNKQISRSDRSELPGEAFAEERRNEHKPYEGIRNKTYDYGSHPHCYGYRK